ncbi:MAG TPA: hypothetical protein VNJ52_10425 [Patescibacteria group bacterium]|nr:hypothetical protein [Patescibacteria group bacterium]
MFQTAGSRPAVQIHNYIRESALRVSRGLLFTLVLTASAGVCLAQTPAPQTEAQAAAAAALIQQSLTAQTGGNPINDVILSGTVTMLQGTDKGPGTTVLVATAAGQSKMTLTTSAGVRTSFRDYSVRPRVGTITKPDGTTASFPPHDLLGPSPAWFFPTLVLEAVLSSSRYASADLGQETLAGETVRRLAIWPKIGSAVLAPSASYRPLAQEDVYLDAGTLLPVALKFNLIATNADPQVKPPWNRPVYLPEVVRFSDYQRVQGILVPLHIDIYINNSPTMAIQFSSVSLNTGAVVTAN